jgi:nitroimidazol reductase NimA-like FMN-containing flavoprotein (pyridoxamine 5'-phosphate oxidase superfamily)
MTNRGLERLSPAECVELLEHAHFGRVVFKIAKTISAFPVYYVVIGDDIYFRTDPGTKLAAAVLRSEVTFQVDDEAEGWAVMAIGFCEEVRSEERCEQVLERLQQWWPDSLRTRVVMIRPRRLSGRRLGAPHRGASTGTDANAEVNQP